MAVATTCRSDGAMTSLTLFRLWASGLVGCFAHFGLRLGWISRRSRNGDEVFAE
jgi:hypothetical protein